MEAETAEIDGHIILLARACVCTQDREKSITIQRAQSKELDP